MFTRTKVKLTVFKSKLAYAGKFWMETRKRFLRAYGLAGFIVQLTEIIALLCVLMALQLLTISIWGLP